MITTDLLSTRKMLLQERINILEQQVDELLINERCHNTVMSFTDISTFEYDMLTGTITTNANDSVEFAMPRVLTNGHEDIISSGIITERSIDDFRDLYARINSGEPSASATIVALDTNGRERFLELNLVTIFDKNGEPLRAVGVRKDITDNMLLQNEKQYVDALTSLRHLSFEANITTDRVMSFDKSWSKALGLGHISSFSSMIDTILRKSYIHPEHTEMLRTTLSCAGISEAFQRGSRLLTFEYLKALDSKNFEWFEQTVNIIKNRLTGDIIIRTYIVNINERKLKELRAQEERRHYEMMRTKSEITCEVNITKNTCVSGHEKTRRLYAVEHGESHTQLAKDIAGNTIHEEDRACFTEFFARDNVMKAYASGKREVVSEYRTPNTAGDFIWMRCTMHLFEDPQTNDLRSFVYIENINDKKLSELSLLYKAQHDMLTGFYDKGTSQEKINEYLSSPEGISGRHAFFIIDIDHFKTINDMFGHSFGDTVLSRTADKLRSLFRKSDILCRIGGDEFAVLMKNIPRYKTALLKAQEMCCSVSDVYSSDGMDHSLFISVGIAYYDKHGKDYSELYACSDNALYYAKEHGRNRFALYHPNIRENITDLEKTDKNLLFKNKNLSVSISEHVFRILYEEPDKRTAIRMALEAVGKQLHISRIYVFENSDDGDFTSNTYEWCNKGIAPRMDSLQSIPFSELGDYMQNFNDEGIFYLTDAGQTVGSTRTTLDMYNIKSLVQVSIVKDDRFIGFVGFDQCDNPHLHSINELWTYRNVANMLGMYIVEMHAIEEKRALQNVAVSVINGLNSYAYVCDPETHRLLYINDKAMELVPDAQVGNYCYRALWGLTAPCPQCPIRELESLNEKSCATDLYNFNLNVWVRSTASWIDWMEDKNVCLIDSVDITKYKLEWSI